MIENFKKSWQSPQLNQDGRLVDDHGEENSAIGKGIGFSKQKMSCFIPERTSKSKKLRLDRNKGSSCQ